MSQLSDLGLIEEILDLSSIFLAAPKSEYSYNSKVVTRASLNLSHVVFDPWIHNNFYGAWIM